jgi:transcriptional regulator with PAS, ATPase and Fis domain
MVMKTIEQPRDDASPEERRTWLLHVVFSVDPAWQDKTLPITAALSVGRRDGGDVAMAIDDPRVSRMHVVLRPLPNDAGVELVDQDSRNGTFVDGERVKSLTVQSPAVVRVGQNVLLVDSAPLDREAADPDFIGNTRVLREAVKQVEAVASANLSVLILGETGTGKELLARRLHMKSPRAEGPLVDVNCAALPPELAEASLFGHVRGAFTGALRDAEGYVAAANGGTLFLDEVNELPLAIQAKLLRVLETHQFRPVGSTEVSSSDFRLVAATNRNLAAEVEAETFRRDLYARIANFVVNVPPLRQRQADIFPLARTFLARVAGTKQLTFSAEVVEALLLHDWPMNIRELKAAVERMVVLAPDASVLSTKQLPPELLVRRPAPAREAATTAPSGAPSKEELADLLRSTGGNVSEIARHYKKHARQIYRWLEAHGLDAEQYRDPEAGPSMPPEAELRDALERHAGSVAETARSLGVRRELLYTWIKRYGIDLQTVRKG